MEWKEFSISKSKVRVFQLEDEPELIYIVSIRDNQNMVVFEDGYDLKTGEVEFLNDVEVEEKFNIKLKD